LHKNVDILKNVNCVRSRKEINRCRVADMVLKQSLHKNAIILKIVHTLFLSLNRHDFM